MSKLIPLSCPDGESEATVLEDLAGLEAYHQYRVWAEDMETEWLYKTQPGPRPQIAHTHSVLFISLSHMQGSVMGSMSNPHSEFEAYYRS